ncbi:VanZ family protein [Hydrogenophaga taeniospiralis]|uniref:VanZ family protein n=1 Tax=Hydrogenophaga taeniospiralis TaxID=65656 RepID=UPI001CF9ADA4|nr:VanZ family protein [Hydrogenophaga taeniospiralis]UCU94697.1 VanZ family protein [Hydrogenophaga taeniospiralis]
MVTTPRSSAWPLALLFAALVVYASLYPFQGWRMQGVEPMAFMLAPLPKYWTAFDVVSNFLGYAPLAFLLALSLLRSGAGGWSWLLGFTLPLLLSFGVETLQNYLPMRVASNLDLALNGAGAMLGATAAWVLERLGGLRRWSQFRADWFVPGAHGSLVLLALWPAALLYPVSVPFGLGQVWDRLEMELAHLLAETPFLAWVPFRVENPLPLSPLAEAFCVALGLLAPLLMGFADMRSLSRRVGFLVAFFVCALAVAGLSSALTYGPDHGWAWITSQALLGLALAFVAGLALLALPRRVCHALMLLCLATSLSLLNRAPVSPYFDQSLEVWEQGRFIRFYGLSQWLGWAWPYAALLFGLRAIARHSGAGQGAH